MKSSRYRIAPCWAHLLRGTPHARPSIAPNLAPRTSRCHDSTCVSHDSSPATDSTGILSVILVCSLVPGCPVVAADPRAPARRLSGAVRGRYGSDALRWPMRASRGRLSQSAVPHALGSPFGTWPSAADRLSVCVCMQRPRPVRRGQGSGPSRSSGDHNVPARMSMRQ